MGGDFRSGVLGRLTVRLGSLSPACAVPLALASVVVFAGGIAVEDELELQTDPLAWVDQSSQTVTDIHTLEEEVGTAAELGVFVTSEDIFTDANMQWMHDFRIEQLREHGRQSDRHANSSPPTASSRCCRTSLTSTASARSPRRATKPPSPGLSLRRTSRPAS